MDEKEKLLLSDAIATAILQAKEINSLRRYIKVLSIVCGVLAVGCIVLACLM